MHQQYDLVRPTTAEQIQSNNKHYDSSILMNIQLPNAIYDNNNATSNKYIVHDDNSNDNNHGNTNDAAISNKTNIDTSASVHVRYNSNMIDTPPNLSRKPTQISQHKISSQQQHHILQPHYSNTNNQHNIPDYHRISSINNSTNIMSPVYERVRTISSYDGCEQLSPLTTQRELTHESQTTTKLQHIKRISVQSIDLNAYPRHTTPGHKQHRLHSSKSFWRSNTSEIEGVSPNELPANIIHPNTYWLHIWEICLLVNILYQAIIVPFTIAFWPLTNSVGAVSVMIVTILNSLTDIVFIIDVYIRFRLGIIEHSVLITDSKYIRRQYLKTWFAFDFIAAVPLDIIQIPLQSIIPLLRINKLVRLVKTFTLFNKFESNTGNSRTSAFVIRLIKLIFYTCLFSHIVACIKYHVMLNQLSEVQLFPDTTIDTLTERSYFSRYLQALYWATGAITGRDDTNPPSTFTDTMYTVCMMIIGMLWFAYIVASLESFIETSDVEHTFQIKLKYINKFMKSYNIPAKTQEQVKSYYSYLWSSTLRYDSTPLITALPLSLQSDLYYELYGELVSQCELFHSIKSNTGLLSLIASKLVVCTVIPNEVICSAHTIGDCMWFIQHGEIEILVGSNKHDTNNKSIATLRTGDYFGEYSIFVNKHRTSTAKAVTYCTLLQLSTNDMLAALQLYRGSEQLVRTHVVEHRQRTKQQESNLLGLEHTGDKSTNDRNAKLKRLIHVEHESNKQNIVQQWTFSSSAGWYQLFLVAYILSTMYNTIIIPVRFAFNRNESYYIALDYVCDTVYVADMLLHTRLRYIDKGIEITDTKILLHKYLCSWFVLHILSIIPFDLLMLISSVGVTSVVRINRVLRLFDVNQLLLHKIKNHINHEMISLCYFIFCVLLLSHWSACIYWSIAVYEGFATDNYSWSPPNTLESQIILYQYLRAQYYSLSLLAGIGRHNFPPTDLDVLFSLLLMLTGVFVVSYIIGKVGYLVLNLNASVQQQNNDLIYYTQHMRYHELSGELYQRIHTYFTHKWTIQHGIDPNIALQQLPYSLRADIMFYLCETLIKSVPKFKNLDDTFVRSLSAELRFLELPEGEYVFRQGFTGNCIYFVSSGLIELIVHKSIELSHSNDANTHTSDTTDHTLKILGSGSFFGEGAIFSGKRSTSARTKSNCQLLQLTNESFKKIVQLNISFATVMQKLYLDRQTKVDIILGNDINTNNTNNNTTEQHNHTGDSQTNALHIKHRHARSTAQRHSLQLEPVGRNQAARSIAQKHIDLSNHNNNPLKIDTNDTFIDDINLLSPARHNLLHITSPTPFTPNSTNRALFDTTIELNSSAIDLLNTGDHNDDNSNNNIQHNNNNTKLLSANDNSIAAIVSRAASGNGHRTVVSRRPLKLNDSMVAVQLRINNNDNNINNQSIPNIRTSISTPLLSNHNQLSSDTNNTVPNSAVDHTEHNSQSHSITDSISKIV